MVKIRLMRVGKRKQPSYRVVVTDSRSPRDGRFIEALGHYAPRNEPSVISVDSDRAVYWLEQGAQPSNTVKKILQISGAWAQFTGEAPPPQAEKPSPKKATPAASVKATPAASVTEGDGDDGEPAEVPEAVDQQAAAPDADPESETDSK